MTTVLLGGDFSPAISRTGLKPGTTLGKPTAPVRRPATTKTRTKHGSKARHCKSDNGPPRKAATTKTRTKHGSKARHCKSDNGPPRKAAATKTRQEHRSKDRPLQKHGGVKPAVVAKATQTEVCATGATTKTRSHEWLRHQNQEGHRQDASRKNC